MSITVYYYGCRCGQLGGLIDQVQSYAARNAIEFKAKNSKYDHDAAFYHMDLLAQNNLGTDTYRAIVVQGNSVQLLTEWSN